MDYAGFRIVPAAEARRILTDGDVRSDVAFQHDVNHLIAVLEEMLRMDVVAGDRVAAGADGG